MEKNYSNFKKYKTMEEVAQGDFPDPNRPKSLFTGMKQQKIIVPGVDNKNHVINLEDKETEKANEAWTKIEADAIEYNNNIYNIDDDYASIEPVNYVIVRCKHLIPEINDAGMIIPIELPVAEMTQNGIGVRETHNSKWKLSTEAVVISLPEGVTKYNVGDTIQVVNDVRMAFKKGIDYPFELPHGYTLPSYHGVQPPSDPKDKHFGYLKVEPFRQVAAILKRAEPKVTETKEVE